MHPPDVCLAEILGAATMLSISGLNADRPHCDRRGGTLPGSGNHVDSARFQVSTFHATSVTAAGMAGAHLANEALSTASALCGGSTVPGCGLVPGGEQVQVHTLGGGQPQDPGHPVEHFVIGPRGAVLEAVVPAGGHVQGGGHVGLL